MEVRLSQFRAASLALVTDGFVDTGTRTDVVQYCRGEQTPRRARYRMFPGTILQAPSTPMLCSTNHVVITLEALRCPHLQGD